MARLPIPKDLPFFRDDPNDWPLFYSAYVNSTTACGYTDVEHLARLQRALQGMALEVVERRLLLPACAPQVMNTLYILTRRPPPRADRLDLFWDASKECLRVHLETAAHLCNLTLLQKLFAMLPIQQHLN